MVRISKIYTKTGDSGTTALVDGSRVRKDNLRVATYGEIDELNSVFGIVRTYAERDQITTLLDQVAQIQNQLFDIGSALATPPGFNKYPVYKVEDKIIKSFEEWIDQITEKLPPLTSFVLPGGTEINSFLHLARTVCRRVERSVVELAALEEVDPVILIYFNRLSDLLFALCREESARSNTPEYLWHPSKK